MCNNNNEDSKCWHGLLWLLLSLQYYKKKLVSKVNSNEDSITLITIDYIVVIITLIIIHKMISLIDSDKSNITPIMIGNINVV